MGPMSHQVWTSLEIAKFAASMATPVAVALIGLWINSRLKAQDRRAEAAYRSEHRLNTPHIELNLECEVLGTRAGKHLVTFSVAARNTGQVLHKFNQIVLRVRGIRDEPFECGAVDDQIDVAPYDVYRAKFPYPLLKTNLVPTPTWNFVFVEPGVTQRLPLTTPISAEFTYLLVHVMFAYEAYTPHTAQAVFALTDLQGTRSARA